MTENYVKEFHEATAKEVEVWHEITNYTIVKDGRVITYATCSCGTNFLFDSTLDEHIKNSNPTYDNPRDILKRMSKYLPLSEYRRFINTIGFIGDDGKQYKYFIEEDYILNPPALCQKAVEFLKGEE